MDLTLLTLGFFYSISFALFLDLMMKKVDLLNYKSAPAWTFVASALIQGTFCSFFPKTFIVFSIISLISVLVHLNQLRRIDEIIKNFNK